jgi:hypothetical protein
VEKLDINEIWDAGRTIRPWNPISRPPPIQHGPIALISTVDPARGLLFAYRKAIDTKVVGKFTTATGRRDRKTVYYLTLISAK